MTDIHQSLRGVLDTIRAAEKRYDRPEGSVALLAVSKVKPASDVLAAFEAGQKAFGENHLQEALRKQDELAAYPIEWHFIGPIQSNKTRPIAEHFQWVHSVDREKIASRLNDQRPADSPPLDVCVQVNVSGEDTKSGVSPEAALSLCQSVASLPRLRLRGLMAIPRPESDLTRQRAAFAEVRKLKESIVASGLPLDTLSMGMSGDLEAAIAEGSTMVRIGTAVFGTR